MEQQPKGKLARWREKTDREKHMIALSGSAAITSLIVFFWLANLLGSTTQTPTMAQKSSGEEVAPGSMFLKSAGHNISKLKSGYISARESLAAIFIVEPYISTSTTKTK